MITIEDLLNILPHRYPFLLIDRVVKLDPPPESGSWVGRKGTVIKNVTFNEPFFAGHFPHRPIMPGVLVIEAMAQAASVVGYRPPKDGDAMDVMFLGVDNARFRRPVVPGDRLRLEIQIIKDRSSVFSFRAEAYVDDQLVAEADLMAKTFPRKS